MSLAFGYGLRKCQGQRLAMLEMSFVVASILRDHTITPVPGHVLSHKVVFTLQADTVVNVQRDIL